MFHFVIECLCSCLSSIIKIIILIFSINTNNHDFEISLNQLHRVHVWKPNWDQLQLFSIKSIYWVDNRWQKVFFVVKADSCARWIDCQLVITKFRHLTVILCMWMDFWWTKLNRVRRFCQWLFRPISNISSSCCFCCGYRVIKWIELRIYFIGWLDK